MDICTTVECPRCGKAFFVELPNMRVNSPNHCPSCGAGCPISGDRAISAHRLLERLEYKNRKAAADAARARVGGSRPRSSLPFPDALQADDSWSEIG